MYLFPVDNVFGCHLATLCAQERTTVPRFVEKCIKAVEKRGDLPCLYSCLKDDDVEADLLVSICRFGH